MPGDWAEERAVKVMGIVIGIVMVRGLVGRREEFISFGSVLVLVRPSSRRRPTWLSKNTTVLAL